MIIILLSIGVGLNGLATVILALCIGRIARRIWNLEFDRLKAKGTPVPDYMGGERRYGKKV